MPKIETNASKPDKSFDIDGVPYQRGGYELIVDGDDIGINRMNARKIDSAILINPVPFGDWTDGSDTPYASKAAFISDVETFIYTG